MAKTESTAVTRLIELAQQRPLQGDFDWFAPAQPKRLTRAEQVAEEVTQVVRVPTRRRKAVVVSPLAVVAAFFAGVLTVAVTTWVMGTQAQTQTQTLAQPQLQPQPQLTTVTAVEPVAVAVAVAEPEPEPVAEPVAEPVPVAVPERVRPSRPARTRPPASFASRPRAGRPAVREGGPLAELRINSKPPCELFIDGRSIGWTPQRGVSVAPGRHTVVFKNREMDVERKVIIDAKVGEVHRVIRDFTEP